MFRIGHLGDTNDLTIVGALAGVEMGLALAGVPHRKGGVQAAMDYFAGAGEPGARGGGVTLSARCTCAEREITDNEPTTFPIVDPHQHFWDLGRNYYPWLCDPKPVPFRYGDYSSLKRNYLPPDYLRDAGALNIVKTVHVRTRCGTRPIRPARRAGSNEVAREYGYPHAMRRRGAASLATTSSEVLAAHAQEHADARRAQFPAAAPSPREAKRGAPGSMDDPKWRRGYALLEKYGFSFDLQTPWWHFDALAELARDFPKRRSSSCTPACRPTAATKALAAWRAALEDGGERSRMSRSRFPGSGGPACRGRSPPTARSSATRSTSSGPSARCSRATFRSTASPARSR